MPVIPYVHRDYAGRPKPASQSHETTAAIDVVKLLWSALHGQEVTYAAICNVEEDGLALADMVVLSERGLGVLELKHHPGPVSRIGSTWYAGFDAVMTRDRRNPHQQVQRYAGEIRHKLLESKLDWLHAESEDDPLQVHTAVCFTHPDAYIDDFVQWLRQEPEPRERWEAFDVLKPQQTPQWAVSLSFAKSRRSPIAGLGFEPYRLAPEEIAGFATEFLDAMVWQEALRLMPTGEPYGVLVLWEGEQRRAVFQLDREEMVIGRDPGQCHLVIPDQYGRVSKRHARVKRAGEQVQIGDLGSTNGAYINGRPLHKPKLLQPGDRITLGGPAGDSRACLLEYLPAADYIAGRTER